jgi:hypothetical protein
MFRFLQTVPQVTQTLYLKTYVALLRTLTGLHNGTHADVSELSYSRKKKTLTTEK